MIIPDRFSDIQIESVRRRVREDYSRFAGGYPSYLFHMSRTVAGVAKHLSVSEHQIESYKTIQNFLERGLNPRVGSLRFFLAYLAATHENKIARRPNLKKLVEIGNQVHLRHFPDFRGRIGEAHNRTSTRAFTERFPKDSKIFGSVSKLTADEYIRENEIADFAEMDSAEYERTRHLCLCFTPSDQSTFDVIHAFYANPHDADAAFETFMQQARSQGIRRARESLTSEWIKDYLVGFAFYDGEVFEGVLASKAKEHLVRIKGFSYFDFYDDDIFTAVDAKDIIPARDPYNEKVACRELRLDRRLNLEFKNIRTGNTHIPVDKSSYLEIRPVLPWSVDQFDPNERHVTKEQATRYRELPREELYRYLFRGLLTSRTQLIQDGGPFDHTTNYRRAGSTISRKLSFLSKLAIMNFDFSANFELESDVDW